MLVRRVSHNKSRRLSRNRHTCPRPSRRHADTSQQPAKDSFSGLNRKTFTLPPLLASIVLNRHEHVHGKPIASLGNPAITGITVSAFEPHLLSVFWSESCGQPISPQRSGARIGKRYPQRGAQPRTIRERHHEEQDHPVRRRRSVRCVPVRVRRRRSGQSGRRRPPAGHRDGAQPVEPARLELQPRAVHAAVADRLVRQGRHRERLVARERLREPDVFLRTAATDRW